MVSRVLFPRGGKGTGSDRVLFRCRGTLIACCWWLSNIITFFYSLTHTPLFSEGYTGGDGAILSGTSASGVVELVPCCYDTGGACSPGTDSIVEFNS